MTWIKTVLLSEVDEKLRCAMEGQRALYPVEYATPVHPDASGGSSIVGSHILIPIGICFAKPEQSRHRCAKLEPPSSRHQERYDGCNFKAPVCKSLGGSA
jgi:hypothetical protein